MSMKPSHPGSARLAAIAALVPPGSRVVDVGTDHARIPVHLVRAGLVAACIATDLRTGPSQAARRRVVAAGLLDQIDLRTGDGLSTVEPGEVDVVLISGIGGAAIAEILASGVAVLSSVGRLVVQPQAAEQHVRTWLHANGWSLIEEHLVVEGGFGYEVLVAEPGDVELGYADCSLSFREALLVGPWLTRSGHPYVVERWERELQVLQALRDQLANQASSNARAKLAGLEDSVSALLALVDRLRAL